MKPEINVKQHTNHNKIIIFKQQDRTSLFYLSSIQQNGAALSLQRIIFGRLVENKTAIGA